MQESLATHLGRVRESFGRFSGRTSLKYNISTSKDWQQYFSRYCGKNILVFIHLFIFSCVHSIPVGHEILAELLIARDNTRTKTSIAGKS